MPRRSDKLLFLVVVLVFALAALLPSLAAAGAANSTITIQMRIFGGNDGFKGRVKSPDAACVANRKVTVYGQKSGYATKTFKDRSNTSGRWKVILPYKVPPGRWYAKVAFKQISGGVCKAAISKSLYF